MYYLSYSCYSLILHFEYSDDKRNIDKGNDEDEEESVEWSILQLTLEWKEQHVFHILLLAQLLRIRRRPSAVMIVKSHHRVTFHQRCYHYHVI